MDFVRGKLRGNTSEPRITALVDREYFKFVLFIAIPSNLRGSLNVDWASFKNEAARELERN
nr:hypothetical protein [Vibrio tritonius]